MDYSYMIVERRVRGRYTWQNRSEWVLIACELDYVVETFSSFHNAAIFLLAVHYQLPDHTADFSLKPGELHRETL